MMMAKLYTHMVTAIRDRCDFSCVQVKEYMMAVKSKKTRAKWGSEGKRKLIDIWAEIREEFDGKLMTRTKRRQLQ